MPVFIVDGFEMSVEKVFDLDPGRIATLTILKDASATAIYGSRASNGVVVIETRAPEPGKINVAYALNLSLTTPDLSDYDLLNAREKLDLEVAAGYFGYFDEAYNRSRAVEARDENGELVYIDKRLSSDRQELGRYNILTKCRIPHGK